MRRTGNGRNPFHPLLLVPSLLLLLTLSPASHPSLSGLVAITISTPSAVVPTNGVRQFYAVGRFGDGTTRDVTSEVAWSSATTSVGSFLGSTPGLFLARSVGTSNVVATGAGIRSNDLLARVVSGGNATVSGSVLTGAGAGLSGVTVGFYQSGNLILGAASGAGGAYSASLPTGVYEVRIGIPGGTPGYPAGQFIASSALPVLADMVFNVIVPGPVRLTGTVRDRSGNPIPGVGITIDDAAGGSFENLAAATTTSAAGTYAFTLYPDNYAVTLTPSSLHLATGEAVTVSNVDRVKDWVLDSTAHFFGVLRDREGNLARNVDCTLVNWGTGASYGPVRTDANGRYDLRVPAGTYRFQAGTRFTLPAGVPIGQVDDVIRSVSISGETNRDATLPTWRVLGRVEDESGTVIASAQISASETLRGPWYGTAEATSSGSGNFTLLLFQGVYRLSVLLPDGDTRYAGMTVAARTRVFSLDTTAAGPSGNVASFSIVLVVTTPPRSLVTGTLRNASGSLLSNARVEWYETATGALADSSVTDGSGRFGMRLVHGDYVVRVSTRDASAATPFPRGLSCYLGADSVVGPQDLTLTLPQVHVRGTVLGTGDAPVSGAALSLSDVGGGGGSLDALSAATAADGRFDFLAFPDDPYRISVVPGGGYFTESVDVAAVVDVDVPIRLKRPVTLSGNVTSGGAVAAGVSVRVLRNGAVQYSGLTNASGAFSIGAIYPRGDYALEVRTAGTDLPAGRFSILPSLSLLADTTVAVALPGVATITGIVLDLGDFAVAGAQVQGVRSAPMTFSYDADPAATTDASGRYTLRAFLGTYDLSANPPSGTNLVPDVETSVVVAGARTQDFVLGSTLLVTVSGLAPVENLSARAICPGNQAELTWTASPSAEAFAYDVYSDNGTGVLDWANVIGSVTDDGASSYTFRSAPLPQAHDFLFAVRTRDVRGRVSADLNTLIRVYPCGGADPVVRTTIRTPGSGTTILREEARIAAELQTGLADDVAYVTFEYRPFTTGSALAWRSMQVLSQASSPNPDATATTGGSGRGQYFVHWDIQAIESGHTPVPTGLYEIRARATGRGSDFSDWNAPSTLVQVVDANPTLRESHGRDTYLVEYAARNDRAENRIEIARMNEAVARSVSLPGNALLTPDATLRAEMTAAPRDPQGRHAVGSAIDLTLSNGQANLGEAATIEFPYLDQNADGFTDDSGLAVASLTIAYWDEDSGVYRSIDSVRIDPARRVVVGTTSHFTTFSLLGGSGSSSGSAPSEGGILSSLGLGGSGTSCVINRAGLGGVSILRGIRDLFLSVPLVRLLVSLYYGS